MAVIHRTTLTPTKIELLTAWLPAQAWYAGDAAGTPVLERSGGFRLDDPEGEVGIEFMVAVDTSGEEPVAYQLPLTYRGAPLEGAEDGLIGTSEHGVLGKRWVYDGAYDPVLAAQLLALLQGRAQAQAQQVSNTPDPSVTVHTAPGAGAEVLPVPASVSVGAGPGGGTRIVFGDGNADGGGGGKAAAAGAGTVIDIRRVLRANETGEVAEAGEPGGREGAGRVVAGWTLPDGTAHRGVFAVLPGPTA